MSNGGYLATIQDSVENSFVLNLANGVSNAVYIGGSDETLEGVWVWEDGTPISYTNWAPGEPSNSNDGEDYLELWTSGANLGRWNDTPGLPTNTSAFVIEYDQDPTTMIHAFLEDFEDAGGWEGRWGQDLPSLQTLVSSPVHTGSGALEFRSTLPGSCHSSRYRVAFEAATGFYSAWANQRHHEAGFGIYVQVQPGVNPDPIFRESYYFVLQAANGSAPQVMSLMRRHEDGSGEMLAQAPTTFLKDEWIQIFVYRKAGGVIECGYVRNGTTISMTATDPDPITEPGAFHLWACSDVPPYTYFDDVSYVPEFVQFCDTFEDGSGWNGRWLQDLPSLQTLVSNPTHSGSGALEFRSTIPGSCHSSLQREDFQASAGLYSVWVNQHHHEAGFGFYLQVQPGVNPDPIFRESYYFVLQASNAQAPQVMSLMRRHEDGSGEMLAQAPTTFLKGEWIQAFVRRKAGGVLECGYVRNCDTITMSATDPNPIVAPGSFHLWACADVSPYTFFDDAGYNPDPMGEGCGECSYSPLTLQAPFKTTDTAIIIDGVINPGEWQNVPAENLNFIYYADGSNRSMPARICNDGTYLYVGASAPFVSDPYFWYGLYFDGDHSHSLHGNLSVPHVTVNYNKSGSDTPAANYYDDYRVVQAGCATTSVTPPTGAQHAYSVSGVNELTFEFRVPLSDLPVVQGDTVGFAVVVGVNATSGNNWSFPMRIGCKVDQWANLVIGKGCCVGIRGNVNKSVSETPDLSDLSLLISYLTVTPKPTLPCMDEANINGSIAATPDLSDLSLLIAFLTTSPKPDLPACGQAVPGQKTGPTGFDLSVSESAGNGKVSLLTTDPLVGILLKVKTTGDVKSLLSENIDIVTGRSGEELTVLAMDLQGNTVIESGTSEAFSFSAPIEIISGEGATLDHSTIYARLVNSLSTLPSHLTLAQNYPNPFNPTTEISYSIPMAAHVTLEVYNLTGQRVATLVNTDQSAGTHTVQWNASQYASGVYMYRLNTGEFAETRKMLLIK